MPSSRTQPPRECHKSSPYDSRDARLASDSLLPSPPVSLSPMFAPSDGSFEWPSSRPSLANLCGELESARQEMSNVLALFCNELKKTSCMEVNTLQAQLKSNCKDQVKLKAELHKVHIDKEAAVTAEHSLCVSVDQFRGTQDLAISCPICRSSMDRPFALRECGHCFCYGSRLKAPPYTAANLQELYENNYIFIHCYNCPLCDITVYEKSVEARYLKDLIEVLFTAFGAPADLAEADPHLNDADIWADVFRDQL
ncbi:hypothetical protein PAXINDRAFT_16924 [Paxillus involutus ATCC 200175]|uniref:RING-type domain-containing protein n=1 Tax=Paxillus involutus ATCC 200175 TaxID=664439 RepID=A0A0C9TS42_PAXIN|nr:hypothetical protein PAXINDRAFT_16924 [Paxillus involutus ATCC 200175]